jgi:adenine-specific DNA-methyltransferase
MKSLIAENKVHFGSDENSVPCLKSYLKDREKQVPFSVFYQDGRASTKRLRNLMGGDYFEHPKDELILKEFFEFCTDKEDIILDFFGGSGTTGHAVMELNKEDNGNRKFILVQIPEPTQENSLAYKAGYKKISDITIDRNKRVVEAIIEEKKNQQPDLFNNGHKEDAIKGLGFKVFKLTKSNFPRVEFAPDTQKTTEENIELLKKYIRDKEAQLITAFNRDELVTEILIKNGFTLNYTLNKQKEFKKNEIFFATDGEKETLICLDISIDMETVEYFKKHNTQKFICLERALDTTKKWNLKHYLGDIFIAF